MQRSNHFLSGFERRLASGIMIALIAIILIIVFLGIPSLQEKAFCAGAEWGQRTCMIECPAIVPTKDDIWTTLHGAR